MQGPIIIVPKPMPPGRRAEFKEKTAGPTCDRCGREGSDMNPIMLSEPRQSMHHLEAMRGVERRDALCHDCRLILKGRR